jgi:hypothetical protein
MNFSSDKKVEIKDYNTRKMKIDLENRKISFINPEFKSNLPVNFMYQTKIRLILVKDPKSLTYLKYCGEYDYDEFFKNSSYKIYQ